MIKTEILKDQPVRNSILMKIQTVEKLYNLYFTFGTTCMKYIENQYCTIICN